MGPLPLRDSLIAAIARSRGHRIVTRDTTPFERMGCKVIDPWNKKSSRPLAGALTVETF